MTALLVDNAKRANSLELCCPVEAGMPSSIRAPNSGPGAPPYASTRRVSFSELLGGGTFFNGRVIEGRDRE